MHPPGGGPWLTLPVLHLQYFAFLLLILINQVAAGALFYFKMDEVSTHACTHVHTHAQVCTPGAGRTRCPHVYTHAHLGLRG